MKQTRETLLNRLRDVGDQRAWEEFFSLYAPLIFRFARSRGLRHADAEEVRDQCLEVVVRDMPTFEYQRDRGGFRGWLYTITHARVVDVLRRRARGPTPLDARTLPVIADPSPAADPAEAWDARWRREHLAYALTKARWSVSAKNYRAFELLLEGGRTVDDVCRELDLYANQVYKARHGVLQAVRRILGQLGEDLPVPARD